MTQSDLDVLGAQITAVTAQLNAGLITITEFVDFIARMKRVTDEENCTAGLHCPFTGLRYPTTDETDWFMSKLGE